MRYLLLGASLLLALCAPIGALRFIGSLVFLLIGTALAFGGLVRRGLSVRRLDAEIRVTRLHPIRERLLLHNRLPLSIPRLIVSESPRSLRCSTPHREASLARSSDTVLEFVLHSEHRGEYHYGPVKLAGSDPFGFFDWQKIDVAPARAVVFPVIYPFNAVDSHGTVGGSRPVANPVYEDLSRFRSVREYVSGDDPKRINWKASAKSGRLYTTEYERTLAVAVRIVLNLSADDYPSRRRDQLTERAVEAAAAIVSEYAKRGQAIGLVASALLDGRPADERLEYAERSGWQQAETLLEVLARVRPREGSADYFRLVFGSATAAVRSLPAGLRLFVVGPTPSADQAGQLRALRAERLRVELFEVETTATAASLGVKAVLPVHPVSPEGGRIVEQ